MPVNVRVVTCVGRIGGGLEKEVTLTCPGKCYKVAVWGQQFPSIRGFILNSLDTSNTRIKIEAPEGFSENKMKGESPRGNPEFAGEAK